MKLLYSWAFCFCLCSQHAIAQRWSQNKMVSSDVIIITNKGGQMLGYSTASGIKILTVDGFAFKDLNKNGQLG